MVATRPDSQVPSPLPTWFSLVRYGAWVGVVSGALEVGYRGASRLLGGPIEFTALSYWWVSPLLSAAMLAVLGGLSAGLATIGPRRWGAAVGILAPTWLGLANLTLMMTSVQRQAGLFLAAGVAVQLTRLGVRHLTPLTALVRRTVLPLLLLFAGVGLGTTAWRRVAQPSRGPGHPGQPNVLFLLLDTVRASAVTGFGGPTSTTPRLSQWADRGVKFTRAFATASWTGPSHASLFTGYPAKDLSIDWERPLDQSRRTLAQVLGAAGYHTAGFAANRVISGESGLGRGFQEYQDEISFGRRFLWVTPLQRYLWDSWGVDWIDRHGRPDGVSARQLSDRIVDWLDGVPSTEGFFVFANYFDAHAPYLSPEPYWSQFVGATQPRRMLRISEHDEWGDSAVAVRHRAYQAGLAYLDAEIGDLLDRLDRGGHLANTIVVLVSDHGEEFNEHSVMGHGHSLYWPSLQVPLAIIWPDRIPAGRTVEAPVSLRRLPATLLELVGQSGLPGPSLARLWSEEGSPAAEPDTIDAYVRFARQLPASYPVSRGTLSAVLLDGFWLLRHGPDPEEVYSVSDTMQLTNLATDSSFGPTVARLKAIATARFGPQTGVATLR